MPRPIGIVRPCKITAEMLQLTRPVDFTQFAEAVRQLGIYWLLLNQRPPLVGGEGPPRLAKTTAGAASEGSCSCRSANEVASPGQAERRAPPPLRPPHGVTQVLPLLVHLPMLVAASA
jgi:hypothetical protein